MKNILIADRFASAAAFKLKGQGYQVKQNTNPLEITTCPENIDGLIVRSRLKITDHFLKTAENLKVIVTATNGFNHIDLEATDKRNIKVMFSPEGNAQSAAEHAWALLLACQRKVPQAQKTLLSQNWQRENLVGHELAGKTLGIIGLGRVGSKVARFAQAFDMSVQAYDPYVSETNNSVKLIGLTELLISSDVISLHVPLTPETRHLINYKTIEHILQAPILINTSRGPVVSEQDLARALIDGTISAAGLDVFEKEPLPNDSPLIGLKNVVLTPHIGANTEEAFSKVSMIAAEKIITFFEKGEVSDELPPQVNWYQSSFT